MHRLASFYVAFLIRGIYDIFTPELTIFEEHTDIIVKDRRDNHIKGTLGVVFMGDAVPQTPWDLSL